MPHLRRECIHGALVDQCRCIGPKKTIVVPCPPAHGVEPKVAERLKRYVG